MFSVGKQSRIKILNMFYDGYLNRYIILLFNFCYSYAKIMAVLLELVMCVGNFKTDGFKIQDNDSKKTSLFTVIITETKRFFFLCSNNIMLQRVATV